MQLIPEAKEDEHELDKVDPLLTLYRHGKVGPANGVIIKQSARNKIQECLEHCLEHCQSTEPTKNIFRLILRIS